MRKVKDAVDLTTNEKIYFKGHAKATYLSDGRNVEDTMGGIAEAVMSIHENIIANYATQQYVQDALAEIPSAESSVFEATYGVTTYDEIVAAVKAKKHVMCFYNNKVYNLCNYQEGMDIFLSCVTSAVYTLQCLASTGKWGSPSRYPYEMQNLKVTSLSASSTDTQYPSAKAVYDFVSNTLGTIINGDY